MKNRISITRLLLIMVFFSATRICPAQVNTPHDEVLERALEQLDPESEAQTKVLLQRLTDLIEHPVNLNRASVRELQQLPWMDLFEAQQIVAYRSDHPPFTTVRDLEQVKGFGSVTVDRVAPFVTVGSSESVRRLQRGDPNFWFDDFYVENISRHRRTLQQKSGYSDDSTGYLGRPGQWYQRLQLGSRHLSLNLTLEHDSGEPFHGPAGFDYSSWHLALREVGRWRNIVIGSYRMSFGQGLLWSGGGMFGKGRSVIESTTQNSGGVDASSSSQETGDQRGVAATYGKALQVTGFYSTRPRTASPLIGDTLRFPTTSGYHRTDTEIARRHNLRQRLFGGMAEWRNGNILLGGGAYQLQFDQPIGHTDAIYEQYNFEGRQLTAATFYFAWRRSTFGLFGETALQVNNRAKAAIAGIQYLPSKSTRLAAAYRSYAPHFQAPFGSALAEQSGHPQNERGFYLGLRHAVTDHWVFSGYIDVFSFPAPRYGMQRPSRGYDWLGQLEAHFTEDWSAYLLVRGESKEAEWDRLDARQRPTVQTGRDSRWSVRMQHSFDLDNGIRFRLRGEVKQANPAAAQKQWGMLFYPDLRWQIFPALRIYLRYTMFQTDGYQSRLYQFENDLLYVLSNTMLQDHGQRAYLVVNLEPLEWLDLQFKYGETVYDHLRQLGSGYEAIDGNVRSRVGVQVRMRF